MSNTRKAAGVRALPVSEPKVRKVDASRTLSMLLGRIEAEHARAVEEALNAECEERGYPTGTRFLMSEGVWAVPEEEKQDKQAPTKTED